MYQLSRSIYRALAPRLDVSSGIDDALAARRKLLEACERNVERLISDRRYFARPAKTLFNEVRELFVLGDQVRVYMVIERHIEAIEALLDSLPPDVTLNGQARSCLASTRKGTPCRREPLPGMDYCPSHKHLEEGASPIDTPRAPATAAA